MNYKFEDNDFNNCELNKSLDMSIQAFLNKKKEQYIDNDFFHQIFEIVFKYTGNYRKKIFSKEDVNIAGDMFTHKKVIGYSGTGSMTLNKTNSRMIKILMEYIKEGQEPDITIVGKLADPGNGGSERISLSEVSFDDLTLFDFEVGAVGSCECPFSFTDMECIDLI